MEFLESFSFTYNRKDGKENVITDAFSRRYIFLPTLDGKISGYYTIQELYKEDEDFQEIVTNFKDHNSYLARWVPL